MRLVGRLLSNAEIAGSSHHIHDLKADRFAHIKTERQAAPPEGFAARAEAGGWSGYRPLPPFKGAGCRTWKVASVDSHVAILVGDLVLA
jgi:hypothetical protein